jgi:hypothetical protein
MQLRTLITQEEFYHATCCLTLIMGDNSICRIVRREGNNFTEVEPITLDYLDGGNT